MTVFIDLDGVLVDFCGRVAEYLPDHVKKIQWPPTEWNFFSEMGLTANQFWAMIYEDFWLDMPPIDDGMRLLEVIRSSGLDYCILTAPTINPSSFSGKCRLLKRMFPYEFENKRWILAHDKRYMARGNILIDDCDANVEGWRIAGGHAILWPAPYNKARESKEIITLDTVLKYAG